MFMITTRGAGDILLHRSNWQPALIVFQNTIKDLSISILKQSRKEGTWSWTGAAST